ncbi:MAG: aminotransferase class I/II-fold pyridoxal phosphate-dependent enzyme [Candidatus Margulisbacteria bacterium]|nr:aminotransferase class I/II-fold pyridoxal phosphate-dependent enzyme [Candidatus Margulisiibacteriota bacterium]
MRYPFSKKLETIPPSGIRRFFDLVLTSEDVISLGVGEPDFVTPWQIREAAIFALEKGYTSYTSNQGLPELRLAICDYVKERFGVQYHRDHETMVTVGVSEGVDITLRALLNPGDEVILPEPTYVCYDPLVKLAGGRVISVDTSKSGFIPDPKAIEKAITPKTKAIILCSPNNPTGRVIPKSILLKISKLALKHDIWVISDEVYAEILFKGKYTSFAALPHMKERTILLSGLSKAWAMTGWRIGYICAPEEVISRALKIHQYAILCAPIASQMAAIEALRHARKPIKQMAHSYLQRRDLFVDSLNDIGLDTFTPEGAFYCFPSIQKTGLSSEEFAIQLLEKERLAVVPGSVFGKGGEGYIRCCYASEIGELKEALKRFKRFLL